MSRVLMIVLSDGLQMPSGFVAESPHRCLIYVRVPEDWIEGPIPESAEVYVKGVALKPERLESLFDALYGPSWRGGNSDGSQYVVRGTGSCLLNLADSGNKPWQFDDPENKKFQYFYFVVDDAGQFHRVKVAEF